MGPCPLHGSKSNKGCFRYAGDGKYHCFSCHAKGKGSIDFTMAYAKIGFQAAVERLQSVKPPMEPQTQKSPVLGNSVNASDVLKPLDKDSWKKFPVPCEWLVKRIPDRAVRERYGVFCYNNPARKSVYSGRVMLPVRDLAGKLFGYVGRLVPSEALPPDASSTPKYLFPKSLPKSKFLFGADQLHTFGTLPLRCVFILVV